VFELPEFTTLSKQINATLNGKTISKGQLVNSPHKFVWYNRDPEEFAHLTSGKTVGESHARGKWLFVPLEPGYVLLVGECGGKLLYPAPGAKHPEKYHPFITFEDGSTLTVLTQMWGAFELYEAGKEQERQYIKGMRPTPVNPEFTLEYFTALVDELHQAEKRSVKSLLTQDQLIPGLGNAIAQDILFNTHLHPHRSLVDLTHGQCRDLYKAITDTAREVIKKGGRNDEIDLFGKPGGYVRLMDSHAAGKACPECGETVEKMQYLGGACTFAQSARCKSQIMKTNRPGACALGRFVYSP
jgi:formamidopyrimidine-DNA glycosylase